MISFGLAAAFVSSARFVFPCPFSNPSHLEKWLFRIASQSKAETKKTKKKNLRGWTIVPALFLMVSPDFDGRTCWQTLRDFTQRWTSFAE